MDEQGRTDRAAWEGEMFRLLAENVLDYALFIVDPHRHVLSWSKGAERLLGFSEAEIVGRKCDLFFTPEDLRAGVPQKELDEALATGRGDNDRWHMRKDGSRFWASGMVTPLRDENGSLRGFAKIMRDRTDLKRAEDAARERERQLQFVTDHAPVLLAQVDADRRFKFVNRPYAERLGLHPRDVIGRHVRDVLGQQAYARIEQQIAAALAGQRVEYEADVPYPGIGTQTMRVAYEPERDCEGRVVGYVAAMLNISDRKRAEDELFASRRRLQALFDNTLDAILLADDQARFVDANPAACTLLGQDRTELLRRGVFDITPPPNGEAGRAAWAAFLRDGRQAGEYEVRGKSGTTAVVEYRAVANVQPGLHLSVLRDVSERKRTEEALRASERRFKALADSAPVGIFETDAEGNCLFVNDRWCEMAGMPPETATGQGWANALHPEDRDRIFREWYAAADEGREFTGAYRFRTPHGRVTWLSGSAVALRDEAGRITGYIGTVTDITGLKLAEEQSRRRAEEIETLMEVMPVAVWLSRDRECRHVLGNRAGYAMLRMPGGANLSKTAPAGEQPTHFRVFQGGRELPPEELPLQQAASHGVEVRGVEEDIVFADGTVIQIYGSASPLFDEAGAVRGAVAGFMDVSALRRAEVALRESEGRLRAIIDNSPSVIFVKDAQGRYLLANKACEGYSGEPPERMVGKTDADFLPREYAERFRADDLRVLQTGDVIRYEEEAILHGQVVTAFTVKFPLRDAGGRPYAVCGIATDITELKRASRAVQESEGRLRALSDNLPLGAVYQVLGDRDGRRQFTYISAGVERLFGVTPAEALADAGSLYGLVHEEDRPRVAAAEEVALRDNAPFDCEFRSRTRSGGIVWVHARSAPRPFPTGQVVWEGIIVDVTARKAAERESEVYRGRLDLVVNSVEVGLWYCDLPFDRLIWNAKAKEHFGLPPDADVTIATFYERLHPDDRERTRQAIGRSISDRTGYDIEYRTVGLDGRERWVRAIGRAFYAPSGEPVRFDGITVDVTERVRQEQALKDADRRKDEFLATLAHELRNPLAPIRNGLQVMKLAAGNAEAVEQARAMMERQLGQMVHLIDDLLDVSRITRGKLRLRRERVDLATAVQSAVEGSRPLIEASAHRLTVALPPEPVWLDADPTRLAQVFSNLLTNAAKYTERAGHIWLTAVRQAGEVVVSVRDTGIGIAAEHLPRLFEMFSQVAPALERSQGGLGIGLSLVKGLVEMHGGRIEARSGGPGKGSEFVVRLPVAGDVPAPQSPAPGGGEGAMARPRRRILVADDNRDAADSLAMVLRLGGHEVHAVHDGQEAVDAAAWFRPDLALLDIGMPKLNGLEACRHIREQPWSKNVILVAITGWGQEEDKRRATEAGFDHHLTKPVDPAALMKLLAELSEAART